MAAPVLPDLASLVDTDAPALAPDPSTLVDTETPDIATPPADLSKLQDTTPPVDPAKAQADLHFIAGRLKGVDNPVAMIRALQSDPEIRRQVSPETAKLFGESIESETLPAIKKIFGITTDDEARTKLYTDPSLLDMGRELGRSVIPASASSVISSARGIMSLDLQQLGTVRKQLVKGYGMSEEEADAETERLLTAQLEFDKKPQSGFHLLTPEPPEFAQWYEKNKDRKGFGLTGNFGEIKKNIRAAAAARESMAYLDQAEKSVREASPDDPRIAGTNVGAFIEGMAQMPGNLLTSLLPGVREGSNFGQLYDDAFKQAKQVGLDKHVTVTDEEAHKAATTAAMVNMPLEELGDFVLFGLGKKVLPKKTLQRIRDFQKTAPIASFLAHTTAKIGTEAGTEALQQIVNNVATGDETTADVKQSAIGGAGGGAAAGVIDAHELVGDLREKARAKAEEAAGKAGPKTAAAVAANPAVQAVLSNLAPSKNYAEEQRQRLASEPPPPPAGQESGPTPPAPPAGAQESPPPAPGETPKEPVTPSSPGEEITYSPWETGGGTPGIGEREDGTVEPPAAKVAEPKEAAGGVPVERVAGAAIASRPDLMQFKRTDDPVSGVNEQDRLDGQWDDKKAGNLLLWEPADPAKYGLQPGQRYIVANGHHRLEFGQRAGVTGLNAQIIRESDGYSASDAMRLGAEVNIADGKGTIYDQSKYLRDLRSTFGPAEADDAARKIGRGGRQASSIAFNATDSLFASFINEQVSPEHAAAIANAAPGNESAQRLGIRTAKMGHPPAVVASVMKAAMINTGGEAETGDLFGENDANLNRAIEQAKIAAGKWKAIDEQIRAVQGAARRPEVAAKLGVNVSDPEGVQKRIAELKAEREKWEPTEWHKHPDLVAEVNGEPKVDPQEKPADGRGPASDLFANSADDPFNLVNETAAEQKAREAREDADRQRQEAEATAAAKLEQDKQQQSLFAAPPVSLPNRYALGATVYRQGREFTVARDLGELVELEAKDNKAVRLVIRKDIGLDEMTVQRFVNLARLRLSNFLGNVGHSQQLAHDDSLPTTMAVRVNSAGQPVIFVNWRQISWATAGMSETEAQDQIHAALAEEIIHVAEVRFQAENPALTAQFLAWINDSQAPGHDPSFIAFLRATYPTFDQLAPYQKAAEATRVILQKNWIGRITEQVRGYLSALSDYLSKWLTGVDETPKPVQAYLQGVDDVLHGRTSATEDTGARPFTDEEYKEMGDERNAENNDFKKTPTKPVEPTEQQLLAIRAAYDAAVKQSGFPAVSIADVLEPVFGENIEIGRGVLSWMFKEGMLVSVGIGDWSIASNRERAWSVSVPAAHRGLMVRLPQRAATESRTGPQTALESRVDALFERLAAGEEIAAEEYDDLKRWALGDPPTGPAGADVGKRFFTTAEFEKAFEKFYQDGDYDAFLLSFKLTDAAIYIPLMKKLVRAQNADPVAMAKAEWFRSVIANTRPPNAKPPGAAGPTNPPPRTPPPPPRRGGASTGTPPPNPQGGFTGQGFDPGPPPPPPPRPTGQHPFNMPALVNLASRLGAMPSINRLLRRARGQFVQTAKGVRIELHPQLFKNPRQAAKTLAHEIGHLFDFIPNSLKYSQLAEKVAPLRNWSTIFGPLWSWSTGKLTPIQAILKTEAVQISRAWRGDFSPNDTYRNSADELYADFISAVLNDPDWAFTNAPYLSRAFFAGLSQKPDAENAYNLVNDMLRGDLLLNVLMAEQERAGAEAVRKLMAESIARTHKLTALDRAWKAVYGGFVNKFGPLMQKAEGKLSMLRHWRQGPGTDVTTRLETEETFADNHSYLMHDRLQSGSYLPLQAAGIPTSHLDTLLRNRRIIHERTATGQYLQSEPDEARELFKWMATEAGLDAKYHDEIDNTSDADLYDLGARLVFDIHQADAFDTVFRAAQRKDAPDFAERGLFAFDVSGFMLNPQGIDPTNAQRQIDLMAADLGPDRFRILQDAARNYYDVMRGIVLEANRIGLFRPNTFQERIAPNLNNYVPFMVIDYFTGHVSASVGPARKGTALNVLPTHLAGQLKAKAMLQRMQRQKQALIVQNFFRTEGVVHGFSQEMKVHDKRLTEAQQAEVWKNGRGLLGFWDKGAYRFMEFEDGSIVKAMEHFNADDMATVLAIGRAHSNFWRLLFTTYSVAFTLWNALRTVRQVWSSHGFRNVVNLGRAMPEALIYAKAIVRGTPLTPELRSMIETSALPAPDRSLAGQGSPEMLERMILAGMVNAEHMVNRTPHEHQNAIQRFLRMPLGWLFDGIAYISGAVESAPKIGTFRTLQGRGATAEESAAYARLEGIPNPGISGKYNSATEVTLMFARVHIQGLRAFRTRALSPRTRGGFLFRAAISQFVWKGFYVAAAAGIIDKLFGGGDDDRQVDFEELVKRSTPYKLEMDDLIYLGWVRPDGTYAPPFGHTSVPADWTPLSIRIPHSEDGRYISPISHLTLTNAFKSPVRPVDSTQRSLQVAQSFVPGVNPGFDLVSYAWQIDNDSPPQDAYRGQPVVPKDEWTAGYASRVWGLSKYMMRQVGVPGMQQRIENPDLTPFWKTVRNIPGLGRLMPLDNYGGVREIRRQTLEEDRVNAAARNLRGADTVQAMHRLSALEAKGTPEKEGKIGRTVAEEDAYRRLLDWRADYYQGTQDFPGLFSVLKAKAAGKANVDADYARKELDRTAREALDEARALEKAQ